VSGKLDATFRPPRAGARLRRRALALVLPLVLAACAGDEGPPPCPPVLRVPDAVRLVRFEGPGRDLTDVRFEAALTGVRLACDYDDGVMEGRLQVTVEALRGPADRERRAGFAYFVAIATADKTVLAREVFELTVPFEGNRTRVAVSDELTPRIPLKPGETARDYRIYLGFALTPEELRYNRRNR
jgi:hypothetical protein